MNNNNQHFVTFNNGLRLIFQQTNLAPVVTSQVWVDAGSADETSEQLGMAHVLEHMLFKGTKKYPGESVARLIEMSGGEINAFTSFDQTVYHLTIASRYLELAINILSDMVQNPTIKEDSLESEKEVICEEIKRSFDSPGREVSKMLFATTFEGHPYSRPIIGSEKSVKSHTRKSILKFFNKWYNPKNLIFIVIGNVEQKEVISLIQKAFSCKKVNTAQNLLRQLFRKRPLPKIQKSPRFDVQYKNINEALIDIAFPVPNINHPDTAAIDMLCAVLCQGDTSFLYHDIKFKRQLVNDISAYSYTPKDFGMILISIYVNPDKITTSLSEVIKKLVQFKYEKIPQADLEKAKINILSDHIFQKETVDGEARKLGLYYTMSGRLDFEETYHKSVEASSSKQITELSKKYINLNKMNAVFLIPLIHRQKLPAKKLKDILYNAFKEEEIKCKQKYKISLSKSKKTDLMTNVSIHTLKSGVKVILKQNSHIPIIAVRAAMLGGVRFESAKNNGTSALLARMFTMGTKNRSATEISSMIESKASSLSGYSGKNTFGLEGEFLSKYTDESLDLFCETLLQPTFPEMEFKNEKKNVLEHIRVMEDNLINYIFQLFSQNIFKIHPYRFHVLGSKESISTLKRKELLNFHNNFTHPDNLFISIVGDLDKKHILNKLESLLSNIPQEKSVFPIIPPQSKIVIPSINHYKTNKEQTHILYGFRGTIISSDDRYVMDIIQSILSGQGGRLFTKLRDEMSLAYSVFATSMEGLDPGYFAVYIACSPSKKDLAIKQLKIELNRLKDKKVSSQELNGAKRYLIGRQGVGLQKNSAQAFSLVYDELYNLGTGNTLKYAQNISKITAEDIKNACLKYFDHDKSVLTTLGK